MDSIFRSSNLNYTNSFIGQVETFIKKFGLISKEDKLLVTVSGGVDSIALCHVIYKLQKWGYSTSIRLLHIHHNSRAGQDLEAKLVENFAKSLNLQFSSIKLTALDKDKNFEHQARLKRYEVFYAYAQPDEKILLGHHIDDSFEWSLMQSLRSSSLAGALGIPVVNGRVIRPFMSVSKKQIINYARCFKLPFKEDPTNKQLKYERNYLRENIIPGLEARYKKYLKHYVYRHSELARRLDLHICEVAQSDFRLTLASESALIYSLSDKADMSGLEELLLEGVKSLNPHSRGTLALQFEKIKWGLKNYKKGPLTLSGGIEAYLDYNMVLLTRLNAPKLSDSGEFKAHTLESFSQELASLFGQKNNATSFPFYVIVSSRGIDKGSFNTSFNRGVVNHLKERDISFYPALRLLRIWSKARNHKKTLRVKFLLNL